MPQTAIGSLFYRKQTQKFGWGLYAAQDLTPGTIITKEEPIAAAVDSPHLSHVCSGCYLNTGASQSGFDHPDQHKSLSRCSQCQTVYYCSTSCQRKDWPIHKMECTSFVTCKKHMKQIPGTFVRVVSRVLYWRHLYPTKYEEDYTKLFEKVDTLTESDRQELVNILVVTRDVVGKDLLIHNTREMYQLISRIQSNGMSVVDSELSSIGASIFATLSVANHSCYPNAAVMFQGSVGVLRAIRPIRKDEQICISYIDTLMTTEQRQGELELRYHFTCSCPLCDPQSSEHFPPLTPKMKLKSSMLMAKLDRNDDSTEECILEATESLDAAATEPNMFKRLNKLSRGYSLLKQVLAPTHAEVISARHAYLLCLLDMKRFTQALPIAKEHVQTRQQILGETHPVVSVSKYLLFRIALLVEDCSDILDIGKESIASLGVSHGQTDSMYVHARKNLDMLMLESRMKKLPGSIPVLI